MSIPIRLKSIPLWKEKWGEQALRKKESEESRTFQRGFRLLALSDEERTFPSFETCRSHGVVLGVIQRERSWARFTGVDLSTKTRPGTAIFTLAIEPTTRRRYPIDIRYGAWRADETIGHLCDVNRDYAPSIIMVENNAFQDSLIDICTSQKIPNDFWMKLEPFTTGKNKADPLIGLPGLQVEFKNKAWVVPWDEYETHPPSCFCGWCRWDREMTNHPLAATSDLCMASWFARQAAELYGYTFKVELGDVNAR